jgi:iron complex transport system substrate-binding protein
MQSSRTTWLPPLLLVALLAAGCGLAPAVAPTTAPPTAAPTQAPTAAPTAVPTEAAATVTLTDSLGREVVLTGRPERIVSLAPSNTEILFALEASNRLVGRDDFSDFPPEALDIPSIGSMYPSVNAEAIVALEPDLVLAAGVTNEADVGRLADLGLVVYATSISTSLDDIYADIGAVGTLIGEADAAAELVASMQARVAAVTATTAAASERPVVFYEIDATEPAKPWTAGPGSFIDQLLAMAGGTNAAAEAADQYVQFSLEQLVAVDPDVIVLGSYTYGAQTPETVAARPGWEGLTAVETGAVYTFDDNLVSRPGPRVVEGLETLARLIHPDLFP